MIPIVIDALGTVIKGLVQGMGDLEIREGLENFQNSCIIEIDQTNKKKLGNICCHSDFCGKLAANTGVINSQISKMRRRRRRRRTTRRRQLDKIFSI